MILLRVAFRIVAFVLAMILWVVVTAIRLLILLVDSHAEPIDPGHPAVR